MINGFNDKSSLSFEGTHSVSNVAIAARVSFDRVELLNLLSSCDIIAYPVEAASARQ